MSTGSTQQPAGYAFEKTLAEKVRRIANQLGGGEDSSRIPGLYPDYPSLNSHIYIAKAPAGGIAAISGTTPGSATCTLYLFNASNMLVATSQSVTVYNTTATAVEPNAYIPITRELLSGKFLVAGGTDQDTAADWYRPLIRFTITGSALTTTDASRTATIQTQYGPGDLNPNTGAGAVTVHNLLRAGGTYEFSGEVADAGLAIWDSGNDYRIVVMEEQNYKPLIRFTLTAALTTAETSETATIQTQWGPGNANPNTAAGAITVHNLLTSAAGVYLFEGAIGAAGLAAWDSGNNYRIVQMECPQ